MLVALEACAAACGAICACSPFRQARQRPAHQSRAAVAKLVMHVVFCWVVQVPIVGQFPRRRACFSMLCCAEAYALRVEAHLPVGAVVVSNKSSTAAYGSIKRVPSSGTRVGRSRDQLYCTRCGLPLEDDFFDDSRWGSGYNRTIGVCYGQRQNFAVNTPGLDS